MFSKFFTRKNKKGGVKQKITSPSRKSTRTSRKPERYSPPSPKRKTKSKPKSIGNQTKKVSMQPIKKPNPSRRNKGWWFNRSARAKNREKHKLSDGEIAAILAKYNIFMKKRRKPFLKHRHSSINSTGPVGTSIFDTLLEQNIRENHGTGEISEQDREAYETDLMREYLAEDLDATARVGNLRN